MGSRRSGRVSRQRGRRRCGLPRQTRDWRVSARPVRDSCCENACLPCFGLSWRRADAWSARHAAAVCVTESLMHGLSFDIAHLFAGSLVLMSFMLLYQDRLYALLNVFAFQAAVLALSVAWQAYVQGAPHLYITAIIALVFKAIIIPVALHRIIVR